MLKALDHLGEILFVDDEKDFGRFSFEGHPSPLHHWQVGLALRGAAGLMRTVLELEELFADTPHPVAYHFTYPAALGPGNGNGHGGGSDVVEDVQKILGGL